MEQEGEVKTSGEGLHGWIKVEIMYVVAAVEDNPDSVNWMIKSRNCERVVAIGSDVLGGKGGD